MGIFYAPISIVSTVSGANPVLIVLIGVVAYKERHPAQHFIGIALAILGIVLLSPYRGH
jgi:drug/metabolite transporter (DMT)-like permease